MANETIYFQGVRTFPKNDKAPEFVLGTGVISLNEFFQWVKENPQLQTEYEGKKQLRFQVLKKKDGGVTFTVDTFKPTAKTEPPQSAPEIVNKHELPENDDLPF